MLSRVARGLRPAPRRAYATRRPIVGGNWKSAPAEKENFASTAPESSVNETQETEVDVTNASLPVDPDNEMAEIDARLNALQNFMKSMGHE